MKIKWTKDLVIQESLKYRYRSEFRKESPSAYNRACKDGYISFICNHMEYVGNRVLRMIYAYEFSDNSVYVGLTFNITKRNNSHFSCGPVFEQMKKTKTTPNIKYITGYIPSSDAVILEQKTIDDYKNNGWNLLNRAKGGNLGGNKEVIWTKEKIHEDALKYNTRNDFRKKSPKAYDAAIRNNVLNIVCSHMSYINKLWTKKEIEEIALRYCKRYDFQLNSPKEYSIAHKHKWLDDVCSHMETKNRFKWSKELVHKEAIKYSSRGEFQKKCRNAYLWSLRKNWIDDVCSHMVKKISRTV